MSNRQWKSMDIHIRDPFILPLQAERRYILFGTSGRDAWLGSGKGFDSYTSSDLESWNGPMPSFRPPKNFWAVADFWAPEVHFYGKRYYMLASFKAPGCYRGTQILVSDEPEGPFFPISDAPVTPPDWECLDGTFYCDREDEPWIVFCQEWTQVHNSGIWAMRLVPDLSVSTGSPVFLFSASEAPWNRKVNCPYAGGGNCFPVYVADGPFLYRTQAGVLLMLWSGFGDGGYTLGTARSLGGGIKGPWVQDETPLWSEGGGHGMLFRAFDGRLILAIHKPDCSPYERLLLVEVEEFDIISKGLHA